jgi:rhamnulokinase
MTVMDGETMVPYLALDMGAGSGRAFLGTLTEGRIQIEELHRFPNKPVYFNSHFFWDFLYLWEQLLESLRRCSDRGLQKLAGIGIDTWNMDFGLINDSGLLLLNPFSYRDQSAETVMEEISSIVSDNELYSLTGVGMNTISALTRLYQLKNSAAPSVFAAARTYLPLPDLFRFYLSGDKSGEESILWGSQLVSVENRTWLTALIGRLGLPEGIFPEVRKAGTVSGPITEEIQKTTGMREAAVIAVAEHDTISAAISVFQREGDDVFISTGTWSVMGRFLDGPMLEPRAQTLGYLNEIAPEGVVFAKNLMGFYIIEECLSAWKRRGAMNSYNEMITAAEAAVPFSLYIDVNHPGLFSSTNMEESLRQYCSESAQRYPESEGRIVRAVLEGLVFSYRQGLDELEELTGRRAGSVHVIGGGTKNTLLCQMIADGTNRNVRAGAAEPAVFGNIGMQALATGKIGSLDELRGTVENSVSTAVYAPRNTAEWDRNYGEMKKFIQGKRRYEI